MQNKRFRSGPIALTATLTTNLLNPPTATGGVNAGSSPMYLLITQLHFVNKTAAPGTVSLWLGATGANAAGTEVLTGYAIPANSTYDWYSPGLRLDSTDFLVGGANAVTTITMIAIGEIGVAG